MVFLDDLLGVFDPFESYNLQSLSTKGTPHHSSLLAYMTYMHLHYSPRGVNEHETWYRTAATTERSTPAFPIPHKPAEKLAQICASLQFKKLYASKPIG